VSVRALVRGIPDAYVRATRELAMGAGDIDVALARSQHEAYVGALGRLGARVERLPADEAHPDCVFVEDTAVIARGRAVVLRSAHPGRRGEAAAVARALAASGLDVVDLDEGTCDGGDVLVVGDRAWVGRTARTDAAGIAALGRALAQVGVAVTPVDLGQGVLHLKCVCSSPAPGAVVVAAGALDAGVFEGLQRIEVPADEAYAANTVGIGGRVLVAAGYPGAAAALRRAGLEPVPLEVSEIRKGDGSLTCLSLVWVSAGR
jgi:dimethylargininase